MKKVNKKYKKKNFKEVVDEMVHPNLRESALEIITKARELENYDELIAELAEYYYSDSGNVFCLHLDTIKSKLVKKGIIDEKNNQF